MRVVVGWWLGGGGAMILPKLLHWIRCNLSFSIRFVVKKGVQISLSCMLLSISLSFLAHHNSCSSAYIISISRLSHLLASCFELLVCSPPVCPPVDFSSLSLTITLCLISKAHQIAHYKLTEAPKHEKT